MSPLSLSNPFRRRHNTHESRGSQECPDGLREKLHGWQIFFIAVSTVIGVTPFYSDGKALEVAGPAGVLLAFAIVGVIAICVMECVSEMIQMFPTPNAIVEFVRIFVDEDLAWIIGVGYWYCYAAIYPTQIISAANFTEYWHLAQVYQTIALYIFAAFVILGINYVGVGLFGWIETFGGILKILVVFGGGIVMYIIYGESNVGSEYINQGFKNSDSVASNTHVAICFVVPIIAYGFLGVETMTVTAYEARDLTSIRYSSQYIAYVILPLYLFCAIGELLNVEWTNPALPERYTYPNTNGTVNGGTNTQVGSGAIIVVAAFQSGHKNVAGFLNGCMIFSALSAGNSSLYVASRVLYGMTRDIHQASRLKFLSGLGSVWNKNGVPIRALWLSFIAFVWLPFLRLDGGIAISSLFEIMSISASVSCLLAWSAVCGAYLRYWIWFRKHEEYIKQAYPKFHRLGTETNTATLLEHIQPVPAIIGLLGSLIIVFVFTTSMWWNTEANFRKVATALGSPIIMFILLIISKIANGFRGPVKLSEDRADLQRAIERLRTPKEEQKRRSGQNLEAHRNAEDIDMENKNEPHNGSLEQDGIQRRSGVLANALHISGQDSESGVEPSIGASSTAQRG